MADLWPWLKLIGRRRGRLTVGMLLLALTLVSGVALLALAGWFLTAAALAGALMAAGVAVSFDIYLPGGGIRLFALTRTIARYAERVYNHDTVLRLLADIRVYLFRGLARRPPHDRLARRGADWLARLTSDVDSLDTLYLRLLAPVTLALLLSVVLVVLSAWLLGATAAVPVAVLLALSLVSATWALHRRTRALAANRVSRLESARRLAIEHIEGQAELTAAGARDRHQARLMAVAGALSEEQHCLDSRIGWHGALATLMNHLALVVVLWVGLAAFQADAIEAPAVVLLALALLGLNEAIQGLPEAFGRLGGTQAAARRLSRETMSEQEVTREPEYDETADEAATLRFERVTLVYPAMPPVVEDWSLTLEPGVQVGLVGRSGSGKSSLADLAAGLAEPDNGRVLVSGSGWQATTSEQRMARVSYLTQDTQLFDDTLRANLQVGLPQASDAALWRVLEAVDLADLVAGLPAGLDTWFGAHGERLSGGEARRLVLARALLRPAPVLILDEPFTGLDRATRSRVSRGIRPYLAGRTLLALAHDEAALPPVERVIRLPD